MNGLVLDNDAVTHAKGLDLIPLIEHLLVRLASHGTIERSVYTEMKRQGNGSIVDGWQRQQLVGEFVDHRSLNGADALFRRLNKDWGRRGLSRQDLASLTVALSIGGAGILTCETLLTKAAVAEGVVSLDLFDVIRIAFEAQVVTATRCEELCARWSDPRFPAGRPKNFAGTFAAEREKRQADKPLPPIESASS